MSPAHSPTNSLTPSLSQSLAAQDAAAEAALAMAAMATAGAPPALLDHPPMRSNVRVSPQKQQDDVTRLFPPAAATLTSQAFDAMSNFLPRPRMTSSAVTSAHLQPASRMGVSQPPQSETGAFQRFAPARHSPPTQTFSQQQQPHRHPLQTPHMTSQFRPFMQQPQQQQHQPLQQPPPQQPGASNNSRMHFNPYF